MIIKNCRYLDWKDLSFASCDLVVEEGRGGGLEKSGVKSVAGMGSGQKKGGVEIDAGGRIVTRAFGCGHHHIYSALARGMPAPGKPPVDFVGILRNIWWVLDRSLDTDMIRASAETTALDLIRNGCSLVIDHHASPFSCEGSLQIIHEVLERTGLNHVLCYEMSDRDGDKAARQGLAESEAYLKSGNPALVGLHASFTVENWLYEAALDLAGRYHSGIHIHAAEGLYDVLYCLKRYGITLAERLAPVLAMDKSIVVHCIHFDDQEREMLAAGRAWIAQNPDSNINNNVGFLRTVGLGSRLMLGTDGMHSDMVRSAQQAWFTGKALEPVTVPDILKRFRNVHHYLDQAFPGMEGENNLVILDYDPPTPLDEGNFGGHFLYGMESRNVWSTIINGKLVYHEREFKDIDEKEIRARSREQATRLWKRMAATGVHR